MRKPIPFLVEKNRVLVPVGNPCLFGCRYCYTRGRDIEPTRLRMEDILVDLQRFAHGTPFETIQFGYDGDPFSQPERGLVLLKQLATMRKHVNFSTKAFLHGSQLEALDEIRQGLATSGKKLSALVSLSCWHSARKIEPHTPSPEKRILTVANLKQLGISVFIAVRPILPHVPDEEYMQIVDAGIQAGCDGFILGPLYADAQGRFVRFIPPALLATIPGRTGSVLWSPHAPTWTRYEDRDRLQVLLLMIEQKGGRIFLSSADAMKAVEQELAA